MALSESTKIETTTLADVDSNSTPETLVVAAAGNKTLFGGKIDNSNNTTDTYLKLWNSAASAPTVGTTVPDCIVPVKAAGITEFSANGGSGVVQVCTANGWYSASVTAGGTGGSTGPTNDVEVNLFTS